MDSLNNITNSTIPKYWVPGSDASAVIFGLLALISWGSWANLLKLNQGVTRFEFFFLDYQAGACAASILLAILLGTGGFSDGMTVGRFFAAMVAGVVNTLGTLLVMASVELSGMTVVFPVVVGIEMTIGTSLLWLIEQKESPGLLFTGVACAMCAVILDYKSHSEVKEDRDGSLGGSRGSESSSSLSYSTLIVSDNDFSTDLSDLSRPYTFSTSSSPERKTTKSRVNHPCLSFTKDWTPKTRGLFLCVLAAIFFSLWPVLDALSTEGCKNDVRASPYAFFMYFRITALGFTWMISSCMDGLSGGGSRSNISSNTSAELDVTFQNYLHEIPNRSRFLGLTAGFIWGFGTLCSLISGEVVGLSVSVTMTRCSPLVATFWGVLVWGEARGMNKKALMYLAGMVVMYCCAIGFIAASAPSDGNVQDGETGNC
jgi:glucose uptake protein GlcU